MENKCILPIQPNVMFTAYQKRGYEMSILLANAEDVMPWYYSKFVNCCFCPSRDVDFDFVLYDGEWFEKNGPFLCHKFRMKKTDVAANQLDYLSLITSAINDNMYVYGKFDEYFIPHKMAYQRKHFPHSFLIYGYDLSLHEFRAIGYTDNMKFELYTFSFDEFISAFTSLNNLDLNFVKTKSDFNYSIDLYEVYRGMYDYYHSISALMPAKPGEVYGFNCLNKYMEYVAHKRNTKEILDMRYSRFFMELKYFMKMRLDYLQAKDIIQGVENYYKVSNTYSLVHNLFVKYNFTRNRDIIDRICSFLQEALVIEYTLWGSVTDQLANYIERQRKDVYVGCEYGKSNT